MKDKYDQCCYKEVQLVLHFMLEEPSFGLITSDKYTYV